MIGAATQVTPEFRASLNGRTVTGRGGSISQSDSIEFSSPLTNGGPPVGSVLLVKSDCCNKVPQCGSVEHEREPRLRSVSVWLGLQGPAKVLTYVLLLATKLAQWLGRKGHPVYGRYIRPFWGKYLGIKAKKL